MKFGSREQPLLAAFEQGREPVFISRYEGHGEHGARMGVHAYPVIILVTKGTSRVRHSGSLELKAGDVHLIPPGDAHGTTRLEHFSGWMLAFWPEQLGHSMKPFSRVRHGCHPVFTLSTRQRRRLEQWFRALDAEAFGREDGREKALLALLSLALVELERASASGAKSAPDSSSLARQVLEYVELHALRPLTLSDVAKAVSRTPAHVANVVRTETGRTVGEWILTQRMGEARRQLRSRDVSMETLARNVGYADVTHFIRQFRRVHGTTPGRWKHGVHT